MPTRIAMLIKCQKRTLKLLNPLEMLFLEYKNKNSIFYKFVEFCEVSQLISTPLYFMASVERAVLLLSLLRVLDAALCFCRW